MNRDQLVDKKVKHQFNGKEILFSVDSLNQHFDGLVIHESDILTDEFEDQDEGYVRAGDVNFDSATPKEVVFEEESSEDTGPKGMTFEEADELAKKGLLISLPFWGGFWFRDIFSQKLLVFTKEGEILDTPDESYKEREDWGEYLATDEQYAKLTAYFDKVKADAEEAEKLAEKAKSIKVEDPIIETGKEEDPAAKTEEAPKEVKPAKKSNKK